MTYPETLAEAKAWAIDPNSTLDQLDMAAGMFPLDVLANPILPLIGLEDPDQLNRIEFTIWYTLTEDEWANISNEAMLPHIASDFLHWAYATMKADGVEIRAKRAKLDWQQAINMSGWALDNRRASKIRQLTKRAVIDGCYVISYSYRNHFIHAGDARKGNWESIRFMKRAVTKLHSLAGRNIVWPESTFRPRPNRRRR